MQNTILITAKIWGCFEVSVAWESSSKLWVLFVADNAAFLLLFFSLITLIGLILHASTEIAIRRCSIEQVLLNILQNS